MGSWSRTMYLTWTRPTSRRCWPPAARWLAGGVAITGRGQFREVISRGSHGYLAVYAAGDNAIVGVIGDAELNIAMLHYRVHDTIARITAYGSEFSRWTSREPAPTQQSPASLPVRRRR